MTKNSILNTNSKAIALNSSALAAGPDTFAWLIETGVTFHACCACTKRLLLGAQRLSRLDNIVRRHEDT